MHIPFYECSACGQTYSGGAKAAAGTCELCGRVGSLTWDGKPVPVRGREAQPVSSPDRQQAAGESAAPGPVSPGGNADSAEKETEQLVEKAADLAIQWRRKPDESTSRAFDDLMRPLFEKGDCRTLLKIYDGILEVVTDHPLFYLNAAAAGEKLAHELQGAYFKSRGTVMMDLGDWLFGEGTPARECMRLAKQAASRLTRVLELMPNLPPAQVAAIRDRIERLRR